MKLKKLLLPILALGLMVGIGTGISCQSIQPVYAAEEGEVTNPVDDIIQEGEQTEEKIKNFKDTYLVPLLSGVSLTSIISMVISVGLAIVNRRTNGLIKQKTDEAMLRVKDTISFTKEIVDYAKDLTAKVDDYKKFLEDKAKTLGSEAVKIKEDLDKMLKIKQEMLLLAEIQAKTLANDAKAVSNGLAEEVNSLVEDIKKLK